MSKRVKNKLKGVRIGGDYVGGEQFSKKLERKKNSFSFL